VVRGPQFEKRCSIPKLCDATQADDMELLNNLREEEKEKLQNTLQHYTILLTRTS